MHLIVPTVATTAAPSSYMNQQTVVFTYIVGLPSSKDLAGTSYTSKTLTTKGSHWYIIHYISLSIRDTLQESTSIPNSIQVQDPLQIQNLDIVSDTCPDEFLQKSQSCFRIVTSIHLDIISSNTLSETQISTFVANDISDAMEDGTFSSTFQSYQNDSAQFKYVGVGSILVKPKDYNEKLVVRGSIIGAAVLVVVSLIVFKCRKIYRKNDDTSEDGFIASLAKKYKKSNKHNDDEDHQFYDENVITPNITFSQEVPPTTTRIDSPYTADWHNHPVEFNPRQNGHSEQHNMSIVQEEKQDSPRVNSLDWQDNPSIPQQKQHAPSIGNPLPYHTRNTSGAGSLESNLSMDQEAFRDHPSTPDLSVGTNSTGSFSLDKYFKKRDIPEDEESDDGGDRGWWN